ncbi:hypothetical protein [Companilactobacillus zhachilii]|uniref:hypothetical protein n=1 Tax=Companilactobacillus zhachilii TaxID=2304606 RepID=UPI0040345C56
MNIVVGFITGTICGWIIYFIARWIKSRLDSKETHISEEPPEPQIMTVKLNTVHLISKDGKATLENIFDSKVIGGYLTFVDKDNNRYKYKEGYVISYVIEPTGTYDKEVKAHINYTPIGKQIEYY